jgi:hypothetical protein
MYERKISKRQLEFMLAWAYSDGLGNFLRENYPLKQEQLLVLENEILSKVDKKVKFSDLDKDLAYKEWHSIIKEMQALYKTYRFKECGAERFKPQGDIFNKSLSRPYSFGMGKKGEGSV